MINILRKFFGLTKTNKEEKNTIQNLNSGEVDNSNITMFKTKVAGVSYGRRQSHLKRWAKKWEEGDDPYITIVREPDNKHDPNAIKVILHEYNERTEEEKEIHIGYIRAGVALTLAKDIDNGVDVDCWFDDILGGYDEGVSYGMLITVKIDRNDKYYVFS